MLRFPVSLNPIFADFDLLQNFLRALGIIPKGRFGGEAFFFAVVGFLIFYFKDTSSARRLDLLDLSVVRWSWLNNVGANLNIRTGTDLIFIAFLKWRHVAHHKNILHIC